MRISKSTKTDVTASSDIGFNDYCDFVYLNSKLSREEAKDICVDCWNQGKSKEEALEAVKTSCNSSTSTDKALKHIKAAIDILGKSGNKDDVTKDSIANLATVMFDIQGSTKVTAATDKKSCKYSKKECIDAIQYNYGFNKKEAENYYKEADCKLLETLVDGFKGNAKKTFYND